MSARRHEATDGHARRVRPRRRRAVRPLAAPAAALLAASLLLAGCTGGGDATPAPPRSTTASAPVDLSFGVYGPDDEVSAYQAVVDAYNGESDGAEVKLHSWSDHDGLVRDVMVGGSIPDVFLISRDDLTCLHDEALTQPVDLLLDERVVDFGDRYSRDAVDAFSADNRLQCMPLGLPDGHLLQHRRRRLRQDESPRVRRPGPRGRPRRWTLAEFGAAADFASRRGDRPGRGRNPTVHGLAPFIYSGGGQVFDDDDSPTSLAFTDSDSEGALERTLEAFLRNPT